MGCDCSRSGPGASPESPLRLGSPNAVVTHVEVLIGFAGLWLGEAWVTGSDVPDYVAKQFISPIT